MFNKTVSVNERLTQRPDDQRAAGAAQEYLISILHEAGYPRRAMETVNANLCGELVMVVLRRMGVLNIEIDYIKFSSALGEVRDELLAQENSQPPEH